MEAHRLNQEVIALQHELLEAAGPAAATRSPRSPLDPLRADDLRPVRRRAPRGQADPRQGRPQLTRPSRSSQNRRPSPSSPPDASRPRRPSVHARTGRSSRRSTAVEERVVRELILDGKRPDGRGPRDLRPISCEVGLLPRAHGSAIFQRGETQALVTTVLGTTADEQRVDGIMDEFSKKFMLDYNMPPFAVGEVRPIRGPGRREIGHGALAERSVAPILPGAVACSRTRSAWSPTSSNRTARARWPRSAARRSA